MLRKKNKNNNLKNALRKNVTKRMQRCGISVEAADEKHLNHKAKFRA